MKVVASCKQYWVRGWMKLAGRGPFGRLATRLATWFAPRFFKRNSLADLNPKGYISPSAAIDHSKLRMGSNVFIGDHVKIIEDFEGGQIDIADRVQLHWEITLQTGQGGNVTIGPRSSVHAGCRLIAYKSSIRIGADVHIGPDCAFFTYNHGVAPGELIINQPLTSRGDIVLEDDVNLGCGVVDLGRSDHRQRLAGGCRQCSYSGCSSRRDRDGCSSEGDQIPARTGSGDSNAERR